MIDIETLSTAPNAAIVSIGACSFDLTGEGIIDTYYTAISAQSNEEAGRHFSGGTIEWWLRQSKEAQSALLDAKQASLRTAIKELRVWVNSHTPALTTVWANGPDFDLTILTNACKALGETWMFPYYQHRCVRTIGELALPDPEQAQEVMAGMRAEGTHHSALDDAVAQAKFCQLCYQMLRLGLTFE